MSALGFTGTQRGMTPEQKILTTIFLRHYMPESVTHGGCIGADDVQFRAPVIAGDVLEVSAAITRVGTRSRELAFEARVVWRAQPERGPSAAAVLAEPVIAVTATGTVVVPAG